MSQKVQNIAFSDQIDCQEKFVNFISHIFKFSKFKNFPPTLILFRSEVIDKPMMHFWAIHILCLSEVQLLTYSFWRIGEKL